MLKVKKVTDWMKKYKTETAVIMVVGVCALTMLDFKKTQQPENLDKVQAKV